MNSNKATVLVLACLLLVGGGEACARQDATEDATGGVGGLAGSSSGGMTTGGAAGTGGSAGNGGVDCRALSEVECLAPCFPIWAFTDGTYAETVYLECSNDGLSAKGMITCALSPAGDRCLWFPDTLIATGWSYVDCSHALCATGGAGGAAGAGGAGGTGGQAGAAGGR